MPKIAGWLFIGSKSVKFVADDDRFYVVKELEWNNLKEESKLQQFLSEFVPVKKQLKSSYSSYYIEAEEQELKDWFSHQS